MTAHYTATATREGRWWVLEVEGIGATQARTLRGAPAQVRDMIAVMLDTAPETITVDVVPDLDDAVAQQVAEARQAVKALRDEQRAVAEKSRAAAARLKAAGMSGHDVADILGVSPQRVSQLLATK